MDPTLPIKCDKVGSNQNQVRANKNKKQETVSGSGISWAICKSAPCSRQITMPAPYQSVFYRPDALPAAQPTASKHRRREVRADKNEKEV